MATIQKIKRAHDVAYRVLIRQANTKAITKTFDTKKLAIQFINSIENDRHRLMSYNNTKLQTRLSVVIDKYLSNEYKGLRLKDEKRKLDFWTNHLGSKSIRDVLKSDISTTLSYLPSHLSNATINRYKAAISVVFSYAIREYDLANNPVLQVRSKRENNERIRFLSEEERTRLFEACRDSQWSKLYLLVLMAITTGARKGELLNLKFSDIDFVRKTAYVLTSKNGQPRVLPLTDEVINELNKFKHQEPRLIFNSELKTNKPMCFNKQWKKALSGAEINNFRFHDLRHSCASLLAQSGASLLEIAEVLGHKQIQVTKRYSHLCIDHKSKLINKVMGSL